MPTTAAPVTFVPQISPDVPWHTRQHIQLLYQKLANHTLAFTKLKAQAGSVTNNTIENFGSGGSGGGGGGGGMIPGLGGVNDQSGNIAYTTTVADNGVLLILDDASPVAVTLNSGVSSPWMIFTTNLGTGSVTFTPSSGTINGAGAFPLPFDYTSIIVFDGTNWHATALPSIPVLPTFADNETPVGTIDGVNTIFTLAHSPSPATSSQGFVNGLLQDFGVDYTLSGATITFAVAPPAVPTPATLTWFYRY